MSDKASILRGILCVALGSICLLELCGCGNDPKGPYEDSQVQQTFNRYWPEYQFAVDQCVAHPALWVIGSKTYAYNLPELQRKYAEFNGDDTNAFNEVRSTLDRLHLKAVYCERDKKVPGKPLTSVSFIYWEADTGPVQPGVHRIVFYSFNDAEVVAGAAASKEPLIPLDRPHWYLTPEKWNYAAGEY